MDIITDTLRNEARKQGERHDIAVYRANHRRTARDTLLLLFYIEQLQSPTFLGSEVIDRTLIALDKG